ncbi:MAG: LysR family transcriptional regulator [Chromatiales bacterium]|nr:LysR family transcriptional regulator [Chromatiales bacterium]
MRRRIRDKRDRVRQLQVFCEVVRAQSLSRAAERLGLTSPAVSMQIHGLEHELGAVLFERGASGVVLTEAGAHLRALAEPLLEGVHTLFDDLRTSLDTPGESTVRLGASSAGSVFVLPRYVRRFHERDPDTVVRLDTVTFREGLELAIDEQVDFVLGVCDPYPPERFDYHALHVYGMVLITALDHPLAGRTSVTPQEAGEFRSVVVPEEMYSRQFGQSAARQFGIDANAVVEVGGWAVLKHYVEAGIGISIVPSLCVSDTDRLSVIALDAYFPPRSYGVFVPRDRLLLPAARRFLDVLIANAPESSFPR